MSEHPINQMMDTTLEKIRSMVDVNTIVGDSIVTPEGVTIIPVSKISYGFAAGGSDLPVKVEKNCFGGGSGAGISLSPIAFLVISNGDVKILPIDNNPSTADKAIHMVPELIEKVSALFKKDKKEADAE